MVMLEVKGYQMRLLALAFDDRGIYAFLPFIVILILIYRLTAASVSRGRLPLYAMGIAGLAGIIIWVRFRYLIMGI
jgi:hypothetical protein